MITLKAYAKVNLSLYITGVRFDGYHFLDTVMQSISLYDTINVSKREDGVIRVTSDNGTIEGEDNICHKAATLFFKESKVGGGADIHITKNIPLAAGLGGGSADAAATLKALNWLFLYPLSERKLKTIALKLGADVPFCLKSGTARVLGIGEDVTYFESKLPLYMLLIKDAEKPSTVYMYKELDNRMRNISLSASTDKICKSLKNGDFDSFTDSLHNDFSALWDTDEINECLKEAGAEGVCISGSGPTVMGFFREKEICLEAYDTLKAKYKQIYFAEGVAE